MKKTIRNKFRLTPQQLLDARRILMGLGLTVTVGAVAYYFGYQSGDCFILDIGILGAGAALAATGLYGIGLSHRYKAICKALAGLELHQYHCAEDLVFGLGISYELAESIVQGEYDHLLSSKLTCYYIH